VVVYGRDGNTQLLHLCRGVLGHFVGQRPWYPIEDIVNKQSGVLVGEFVVCVGQQDSFLVRVYF